MNIFQLKSERSKTLKELEAVRARIVDCLEFGEMCEEAPESLASLHTEAQRLRTKIAELDALIEGEV